LKLRRSHPLPGAASKMASLCMAGVAAPARLTSKYTISRTKALGARAVKASARAAPRTRALTVRATKSAEALGIDFDPKDPGAYTLAGAYSRPLLSST